MKSLLFTCLPLLFGAEPIHWSFQPVTRPAVPAVRATAWPRSAA